MLRAARESSKGQVIAVVQPHRYTRLASLFEPFCTCFNDADTVIVAPRLCRPARPPIPGVDRDALVQGLRARGHRQVIAARRAGDLARIVERLAQPGDYRRLPRRRQHHAMGLRAAGRAARRWGGGVRCVRPATMGFADMRSPLTLESKHARSCAGGCWPNQPLAELTWFRVGGPAQAAVHAGGRERSRLFPRALCRPRFRSP